MTVEGGWGYLKDKITEASSIFVPKVKRRRSNKPPCINRKCLRLIRKKQRAWNKYSETRNMEHWNEYLILEKASKKTNRNAKRNFEKKVANKGNKNPSTVTSRARPHSRQESAH